MPNYVRNIVKMDGITDCLSLRWLTAKNILTSTN